MVKDWGDGRLPPLKRQHNKSIFAPVVTLGRQKEGSCKLSSAHIVADGELWE